MPMSDSSVSGCGDKTVCVTGAGGFIASWLVKLLLEKGYTVRGTLRNPDDLKNSHLRALEGAAERLTLLKADLLDYDSLMLAITGCDGVFHTASPITADPEQMIEPAVMGTKNVVRAAADAGLHRVVDESYWSDLEYCKRTKNWHCYGKTVAEQVAWKTAAERGVDLTGSAKTYTNAVQAYVDVRDAAAAHLAVYEWPAAQGRYLCAESMLHRGDVVRILKKLFPQYPLPTKCSDEVNPPKKGYEFTTKKLRDLGVRALHPCEAMPL